MTESHYSNGLRDQLHPLSALRQELRSVDDWGVFRRGARAAAVNAILYRREGRWCIPFVVRRADLRSHPGQVGLPGGNVRPGEGAWAAAARETEEEIGVPGSALEPLGAGPVVYTAVSNYSVVPFVSSLADPPGAFSADPHELDGVVEVALARLVDEAEWRERPGLPGPQLAVGGVVIWGLTARILAGILPPIAGALA
ncbi:MAG: CoA pyrophosphatase [Candidatus Dormibacteraeota bacterium]|nr:CoA pyrophosphatase [Candidatus Dormibacteraeota bacterium]MBO0704243.1 CoA pyrophosphatase [Candidatus Dormibacteraeota bacterium]MBO0760501.1 CoA pyrophosphatase [Candidatus Dormibacteraeota bacterium]